HPSHSFPTRRSSDLLIPRVVLVRCFQGHEYPITGFSLAASNNSDACTMRVFLGLLLWNSTACAIRLLIPCFNPSEISLTGNSAIKIPGHLTLTALAASSPGPSWSGMYTISRNILEYLL